MLFSSRIESFSFYLALFLCLSIASAQVGIGTSTPQESAMLDIEASSQGVLIPRVNISNLNNQSPITTATIAESLIVFNTNASVGKGFYYWNADDSVWTKLLVASDVGSSFGGWYEATTTNNPVDIDDDLFTNGNIGINTDDPESALHIYEQTGTAPTFVNGRPNGSLILEHGNNGGASSIVFRSAQNISSDYGYITYEDNGSVIDGVTSNENGLLTIGIQNDGEGSSPQDDINIAATGVLKISLGDPNTTDYNFGNDQLSPVSNNNKSLGNENSHWEDLFIKGELRDNEGDGITVTLNQVPDYRFLENAFIPLDNRGKDLGLINDSWDNVYADAYFNVSDRRLKTNINPLGYGLDQILPIKTYSYIYKSSDDATDVHYGVIAQELQQYLPELVQTNDDEQKLLAVNYIEFIPVLINAIQEQQKIIESQNSDISKLVDEITQIKKLIANSN